MNFKQFLMEAKNEWLHLNDPLEIGLEIKARIEIVPGEKGTGVYMGTLNISNQLRHGGGVFHTQQQHSLEAAQTALRELLQRPKEVHVPEKLIRRGGGNHLIKIELPGLAAAGVHTLGATLFYGGSWAAGALESRPEYNSKDHEESKAWYDNITSVLKKVEKEIQADTKKARKFGDGPPQYGQWLTQDDIKILPDMIKTFGDFWVVIKWAKRARQVILASALARHYDQIFADAEVKTDDYAREIFVREKPMDGIN